PCAAMAVTAWAWLERTDLFLIPRAWREVQTLHARVREIEQEWMGERADLWKDSRYERAQAELDRAFSELLRLQSPDFEWARNVSITPVRTQEGDAAHLAWYEPRSLDPHAPVVWPASFFFYALDDRGRLIDETPFDGGHVSAVEALPAGDAGAATSVWVDSG